MRRATLFFFALFFFTLCLRAYAQGGDSPARPVILTDQQDEYPLGRSLELLEDPGGELTIEDVTSPEYAEQFSPSQVDVPSFGYTDSAYWVRLRLRNESASIDNWLLVVNFENMHFVDLYSPSANGDGFELKQTGIMRPPSTREIPYPRLVFELTPPDQSTQTNYLRFKNGAPMILSLTLWQATAFFTESLRLRLSEILFYGVMVGLLVYNVFLSASLRDVNYLYLAALLASAALFEVSQTSLLEIYLVPSLYQYKTQIIGLSSAAIIASLILFFSSFLGSRTIMPNLHRLNLLLMGFAVLFGLGSFAFSYHQIAAVLSPTIVLIVIFNMITVAVAWRRGFHAARFLLVAMMGLLACMLVFMLARMNIILVSEVTENAFRFGFIWMAIGSSLALADRINLLKLETEQANRELMYSEKRLAQTLEAMPVGVVVYGPDQRPTFLNKRTAEILTNPERGIGPHPNLERTLPEAMDHYSFRVSGSDDGYTMEQFPVYRALQGEPAHADDIEADLVDRRLQLEAWASPVFDETGNVESAVVAFQDITTRRQQEVELDAYRQRLELLVQERTNELSDLNKQLSEEVAEREVLEGLLYKRIQWMSATARARQSIRTTADLPTVYATLSSEILQLLDAPMLFLIGWRDEVEMFEFRCSTAHQNAVPDPEAIGNSFDEGSLLRRALEPGEFVVLSADEVASIAEPIGSCFAGSDIEILVLAPIVAGDSVTGVLGLALTLPEKNFSESLRELFMNMTLDLANLAREARFLDLSRELVAAGERNRLARDLHDSVTQVLFSASLVAEVLPQIWRRDPELAMESLEELRRLTRGALAEMRTMLLELRPAAVVKSPLHELLAQLTEATTSRTKLPFRLFIEQTPWLPKGVHAAIYRIAQEALNNVSKHAHANSVTLSFQKLPLPQQEAVKNVVGVRLVIEDDGVGFDVEDKQVEHLGLGIMRERASEIKADLDIKSRIGQGTRVTLDWCGVAEVEENE